MVAAEYRMVSEPTTMTRATVPGEPSNIVETESSTQPSIAQATSIRRSLLSWERPLSRHTLQTSIVTMSSSPTKSMPNAVRVLWDTFAHLPTN
jgi:hypothetical protein